MSTPSGASAGIPRISPTRYLGRHLQVFIASLGQLARHPVATLLTAAVIGISLALPMGLHVLVNNARSVSSGWENAAQISLFLKKSTSDAQAKRLQQHLQGLEEIQQVTYISSAQALAEFKQHSGFGQALDALTDNPLPAVLVITPRLLYSEPGSISALTRTLGANPMVDSAQLDMQWLKRLYALMDMVERGIFILAALLGMAVILITGNTIRLAIENRRDEIVTIKLIGGTNAFIRRPFLYSGLWYGLFGGLLAWLLIFVSLGLLSDPINRLSTLYQSSFALEYLGGMDSLRLIAFGVGLGLLGSWTAVGRHLRAIEPT
jgi:cell division transport system permease protein